jgi:hypothetical protein
MAWRWLELTTLAICDEFDRWSFDYERRARDVD